MADTEAPVLDVADEPDAKLTAALAAAQATFPPIAKTKTATTGSYSYTYADLADVLAAVRPILATHGLAITQRTSTTDDGRVGLVTELRHVGGGRLWSDVLIGQSPSNPQQFGGALTYLRRYELVTLLGIAAEEDLDVRDVKPAATDRASVAPEPPDWMKPASDTARQRAQDALVQLVGDEPAAQFMAAIEQYAGGTAPSIVTRTILGLATRIEQTQQDPSVDVPAGNPTGDRPTTLEQAMAAAGASGLEPADDAPGGDPDCTCPDAANGKFDDACPLPGHGIPF